MQKEVIKQIFYSLVEKIEIFTPTNFVFELRYEQIKLYCDTNERNVIKKC